MAKKVVEISGKPSKKIKDLMKAHQKSLKAGKSTLGKMIKEHNKRQVSKGG